jgi:hypothetical protein
MRISRAVARLAGPSFRQEVHGERLLVTHGNAANVVTASGEVSILTPR